MAKITRAQTKAHDEAMALLSLARPLSEDEVEFCLRNFNPMASYNVGKNAVFFTPYDLASDLGIYFGGRNRIVDLCAGIGMLSYHILLRDQWEKEIEEMVCVEINPEYVDIGKKLVPRAKWVCANVFDLAAMSGLGIFDACVSNPPYGNIASKSGDEWMSYHGPAHLQVAEIALRLAGPDGVMIIPRADQEHQREQAGDNRVFSTSPREKPFSTHYLRWKETFRGITLAEDSIDASGYKNEWQGASPDVVVARFFADGCKVAPLGFPAPAKPKPAKPEEAATLAPAGKQAIAQISLFDLIQAG